MIIDRFEGEYAVVEKDDGGHIEILRNLLPKDAGEGDILLLKDGKYTIDNEETKKARKRAVELRNSLWK